MISYRQITQIALCSIAMAIASAETVDFQGSWERSWPLDAGESVEIQVGIQKPAGIAPNARIEVSWQGPTSVEPTFSATQGDLIAGQENGWSKILHALDPDVFLIYKALRTGLYTLRLDTVTDREQPVPSYHRDTGLAPQATAKLTGTTAIDLARLSVNVHPVPETAAGDIMLETELNNAPEQSIELLFEDGVNDQVLRVVGSTTSLSILIMRSQEALQMTGNVSSTVASVQNC